MTIDERLTVIITGGTKGLGKQLSLNLGNRGHRIVAIYRSDDEAARILRDDFERLGILGECVRCNIAEENIPISLTDVANLMLINNACPAFVPRPFHLTPVEQFLEQWSTMVQGAVRCIKTVLPDMVRQKGGVVAMILSRALFVPHPKGFSAYLGAKSALRDLCEALAAEYADRGIKFLSISPGFMRTSLTEEWPENLIRALSDAEPSSDSPEVIAARTADLLLAQGLRGRGENYFV